MNRVNADHSPNSVRQPESLRALIEEISNELSILDKNISIAVDIADRLHGKPPATPAQGLTAVQSEPFGLLEQLRKRCDAMSSLNVALGHELTRISNAL